MAKTKKRSRGKNGFTVPIAIVAGLLPAASNIVKKGMDTRSFNAAGQEASRILLGYNPATRYEWGYNENPGWYPHLLKYGLYPILFGFAGHWLAGKIGINRALGRAGIPFIRI